MDEQDDIYDEIVQLIISNQFQKGMSLYVKYGIKNNLVQFGNGLVKDPPSLKIYLDQVEDLEEDHFSSMICRCIEQEEPWSEESFQFLLDYQKKTQIKPYLLLCLPHYKNYSKERLTQAKEVGLRDPFLEGEDVPYPYLNIRELGEKFRSVNYRGFRHAYHIAKYGNLVNRMELIERWNDGYDCTLDGVCAFYQEKYPGKFSKESENDIDPEEIKKLLLEDISGKSSPKILEQILQNKE